ncbi:hypothetical protein [Enterovirga sp.]|uniref:hypothetical protein n=1 Tax=Enterovirga sp. TaxID=2026350 RepID=UPI002CF50E23|nr:hypothetical protein [Enterovirga sp.]HMO29491.1 hypothetical protein [Enterovirga sp.]
MKDDSAERALMDTRKVGVFMRTHIWNNDATRNFRRLREYWRGDVVVAFDEGGGAHLPEGIPSVTHSAAQFLRLGLPLYPTEARTMWYNGDYVLYNIALNSDYEYFILCEYDCIVPENFNSIVENMINDNVEFVIHRYGPAPDHWYWKAEALKWYEAEGIKDICINCSIFPFVFCKRNAILRLLNRRQSMFWANLQAPWMFCESFVATEAERLGLRAAPLSKYATANRVVFAPTTHWEEVGSGCNQFIHPVLTGDLFVNKIFAQSQNFGQEQREWLEKQRTRCRTEGEREIFDQLFAKQYAT